MEQYADVIIDPQGNVVVGAMVSILDSQGAPAQIFGSNNQNSSINNPILTGSLGEFSFFARNGRYRIGNVSVGGRVFQAGYREIILNDPDDGAGGLPGRVGTLESSVEQLAIEAEAATQALDALQLPDYAALRAYKGPRKSVYVTGAGIAGMFVRDDADTTSADNGGTVIVAGPKRFKRVFAGALDIRWFGLVADGVADDTLRFRAAAALGLPIHLHGITCRIASGATVTANIYGPGKVIGGDTIFTVDANGVSFIGVEIEGATASGTAADVGISAENKSNLRIERCTLKNVRVRHRNTLEAKLYNFWFRQNTVTADFSSFDYMNTQNDVITVRGVDGIWIQDNAIDVTNVHRVGKISDTEHSSAASKGTEYRSRNVHVSRNRIAGSTGSGKQVFDFFSGTSDVCISENSIRVTGFGTIIENKTGITQDYTQNFKVTRNIKLASDGQILNFQGSHGATTAGHDVGYQNLDISHNNLERIGTGTRELLEVRFYDYAAITENNFIAPVEMTAGSANFALSVRACADAFVCKNKITNGAIYFTAATSNSNGAPFNATSNSIKAHGNFIDNFGGDAALGGIYMNSFVSPGCFFDIQGNTIRQLVDNTSQSVGAVAVRSSTIAALLVAGNVGNMVNPAENRLRLLLNTIGSIAESDNNWNTVGRSVVAYDPPSIAAAGLTTTTVTVAGAVASSDVAVAEFGRATLGLIVTAWVSASNTVTVQFYNPTAAVIDLTSANLRVSVHRKSDPA